MIRVHQSFFVYVFKSLISLAHALYAQGLTKYFATHEI